MIFDPFLPNFDNQTKEIIHVQGFGLRYLAKSYDSPHSVIIDSFLKYLNTVFCYDQDSVDEEKLNNDLNLFIKSSNEYIDNWKLFDFYNPHIDCYYLSNSWERWMRYPVYEDDHAANTIESFTDSNKWLALIYSDEWNFFDETSLYLFPAVFYSFGEMQSWFVWAIKKRLKFFPNHSDVIKLVEKYIDTQSAIELFNKKLNRQVKWDYGPARISEPHFDLWHEKTKDERVNDWIRQWLVD